MVTTIQIDEEVKEKLDELKIHHRETYNELIYRIINSASLDNISKESLVETIEILSDPEVMRNIAQGLEEYKRGEGIGFDELKKELDLDV